MATKDSLYLNTSVKELKSINNDFYNNTGMSEIELAILKQYEKDKKTKGIEFAKKEYARRKDILHRIELNYREKGIRGNSSILVNDIVVNELKDLELEDVDFDNLKSVLDIDREKDIQNALNRYKKDGNPKYKNDHIDITAIKDPELDDVSFDDYRAYTKEFSKRKTSSQDDLILETEHERQIKNSTETAEARQFVHNINKAGEKSKISGTKLNKTPYLENIPKKNVNTDTYTNTFKELPFVIEDENAKSNTAISEVSKTEESKEASKDNINVASQSKGTEGTIEERTRLDPIGNVYKDLNKLQNSALISGPKNISGVRPTLKIRETESIYPTSPSNDELYGKASGGSWNMETSVPFNDLGEQSWATTTKREFIKGSESVPAADIGTANLNNDKYTGSFYNHPRIQAPVADGLLARSNIASLDTMVQVANAKGKALSEELENKESITKKRGTTEDVDSLTKATKGANAINAVNAAVGLGLGIYGAHQINKMQRPSMVSAPQIEAAKIRDTGAQAMAARKGMIEQSANTSREALRRAGRSDLNATITAGETRALNEAAGAIEGMRANINAANVAAENRVREINASTKMQADQFNSQIQSAFNQFKSQLGTQNLSTTVQNISGNLGGIAQNIYAKELRLRDEDMQKYAIRMGAV